MESNFIMRMDWLITIILLLPLPSDLLRWKPFRAGYMIFWVYYIFSGEIFHASFERLFLHTTAYFKGVSNCNEKD